MKKDFPTQNRMINTLLILVFSLSCNSSCRFNSKVYTPRTVQNGCFISIDMEEEEKLYELLELTLLRPISGKNIMEIFDNHRFFPDYLQKGDFVIGADECNIKNHWDFIGPRSQTGQQTAITHIPKFLLPMLADTSEVKKYIKEFYMARDRKRITIRTSELKD